MAFTLPDLPYPETALQPYLSAETLHFHHGKHHLAYINKTNELVANKDYPADLAGVLMAAHGRGDVRLYQQSAQAWNHEFYWRSMRPDGGGVPGGAAGELMTRDCGGYAGLRDSFIRYAGDHFGSGWAWLVLDAGRLGVMSTHDAGNPMVYGALPLAVLDLWEHAYYLDHRNNRRTHIETFLDHLIDWDFVNANIVAARQPA